MRWLKAQLWDLHVVVTDEYENEGKSKWTEDVHRLKAYLSALGRSLWPESLSTLKSYIGKGIPLSVSREALKAMSSIAMLAPQQACTCAEIACSDRLTVCCLM